MKRLFIALPVSEEVRAAAAALMKGPGVRWEPPEKLHVTVEFLGEVAEGDGRARLQAMKARPFEVSYGLVEHRSHVIWARVEEGAKELRALSGRADYLPHLTLGRPRKGAPLVGGRLEARQKAERLVLYESKDGKYLELEALVLRLP